MNEERKGFMFLRSYFTAAEQVPDESLRLTLLETLIRYALDGTEPEGLTWELGALFSCMRPNIDSTVSKSEKRKAAGKLGGEAVKANESKTKQTGSKTKQEEEEEEEVEEEAEVEAEVEAEQEKETKAEVVVTAAPVRNAFRKPTQNEVSEFIRENGMTVDASHFLDYYEANGWMVGRSKMKDWKAALRNWERREKERAPSATQQRQRMGDIACEEDECFMGIPGYTRPPNLFDFNDNGIDFLEDELL